ncbi:ascorbate-dependent monooxygenase [Verrucomicrobia bacterium]|nr:ascorbate-dependent monooxygenase [Verrucomicrobiota bacterium]
MNLLHYRQMRLFSLDRILILALALTASTALANKAQPTFSEDVADIIFNNCTECHRPGQVAPFALLSYNDVRKKGQTIARVVESEFMPPWKADQGIGKFHNERRLSPEEIATVKKWVELGMPEGDASQTPAPPSFSSEWALGAPDQIFKPDQAYTLGVEGGDEYRCFVIPTGFKKNMFIKAVEMRPGNRSIVHHVIAFIDPRLEGRKRDAETPEPGYISFGGPGVKGADWLAGWAPGNNPRYLPQGVGKLVPAGADLILQVHYHRSGKPETDLTEFGVYFADEQITHRARIHGISDNQLNIPAGNANYKAGANHTLESDITIFEISPHMHLLGKSMEVNATLPDGKTIPMIRISKWDFNWQLPYIYEAPLKLPAGTQIKMKAVYDNSANNPANPFDPPQVIRRGEETTDEMCIAFFTYIEDKKRINKKKRLSKNEQ